MDILRASPVSAQPRKYLLHVHASSEFCGCENKVKSPIPRKSARVNAVQRGVRLVRDQCTVSRGAARVRGQVVPRYGPPAKVDPGRRVCGARATSLAGRGGEEHGLALLSN